MDTQILIPRAGQISLLIAPSSAITVLMEMTAQIALQRHILILDGGNRFDGYGLAQTLRKHTVNINPALQNVLLSRIFTCYQMKAFLSEFNDNTLPILVLDLLATFLDENVKLPMRQSLLSDCLSCLQKLSRLNPVVLWVRKRSLPQIEDEGLLDQVFSASNRVWHIENSAPGASQPALFNLSGQFNADLSAGK